MTVESNKVANAAAKYNEFFGGWVAFKNGQIVRAKNQSVKVFKTSAEAIVSAEKSTNGGGR